MHGRPPRDRVSLGVVTDDLVVLEKVARGLGPEAVGLESRRIIADTQQAYAAAGLPRHPEKGFLVQSFAEVWGSQVDGDAGWVRPNWNRLIPLVHITVACLRLPVLSVSLLEVLAGSWVSILSVRRRSLCLLQEVYRLQHGQARNALVRPTPALRAELFCLAVLAPQFRTDLRAQTSRLLAATDADCVGAGVVAPVARTLARELIRHTLTKGHWSRLLSPSDSLLRLHGCLDPSEELPEESYTTSPLDPACKVIGVPSRWFFQAAALYPHHCEGAGELPHC